MSGPIDFWYEFASTYSYVAMERVARSSRSFQHRPFLLGPVFAAQAAVGQAQHHPRQSDRLARQLDADPAAVGEPSRIGDPLELVTWATPADYRRVIDLASDVLGDDNVRVTTGTVFRIGHTNIQFQSTQDVVEIELSKKDRFDMMLGASPAMREIVSTTSR